MNPLSMLYETWAAITPPVSDAKKIETMLAALKRAEPAAWILATGGHPDAVAIHDEIMTAIRIGGGR